MNRLIILVSLPLVILASACREKAPESYQIENIPPHIRTAIESLDKEIIQSIRSNDLEAFKSHFSDKLIEKTGEKRIDTILMLSGGIMRDYDFTYKDQFYISNAGKKMISTELPGPKPENSYVFQCQPLNKKIFVSLILPKGPSDQKLLTLIYGLYGREWKLNIFQFGQYSINKLTAVDYYKMARNDLERGFLVDAMNNANLSQICLNPSIQFFRYKIEKEIVDLNQMIMEKLNSTYTFPLTIEEVSTKPVILDFHPQRIDEGTFPIIIYQTKVNLKDIAGLNKENQEIRKVIGKIFPGIDQDKKYIFYRASNRLPGDGQEPVEQYGFVQKIENSNQAGTTIKIE